MKSILYSSVFAFILLTFSARVTAQQLPNRHSSVSSDAWLSCTTSANPNTLRGTSHWIRYDLGYTYQLGNVRLWNFNVPDSVQYGFTTGYIDVSTNGTTWTNIGEFNLSQASSFSTYEGQQALNMNGASARYLLITPKGSNGTGCVGLSEARFDVYNTALPVKLNQLVTTCLDDETTVAWSNNTNDDVSSYEVETSADGESWTKVASTPKVSDENYKVKIQKSSSLLALVRIKSLLLDGAVEISNMVSNPCVIESSMIKASPNPFSQSVELTLDSDSDLLNDIEVVDVNGRIIRSIKGANPQKKISIDLNDVNSGTYFVRVKQGLKLKIIQLVKI